MADIKKLVKAWATFRDSNPYGLCSGREFRAIREPEYCMGQMIADTIDMLKEQEWQTKRLTPTEPKVTINAYGTRFYYCPHCARPLMKSGIKGEPRHCVDCGQAVKWG